MLKKYFEKVGNDTRVFVTRIAELKRIILKSIRLWFNIVSFLKVEKSFAIRRDDPNYTFEYFVLCDCSFVWMSSLT